MAESAKGRTTRKMGKRWPGTDEYAYVVRIEEWEWAFSFGLGDSPRRAVHRLSPPAREADRAVTKPRRIETYERDDQTGPTGVGSVSVSRGKFEALLTMPGDALTPFFANADCRKIEIHRSAWRAHAISPTIKSYRLEMNMDEDDMPADA